MSAEFFRGIRLALSVEQYRQLLSRYARQPQTWRRSWRYRVGRWLCGRGPFAPYLDQERWETECRTLSLL